MLERSHHVPGNRRMGLKLLDWNGYQSCLAGVKLPGHSPGFPGKVISFHSVPLEPAYPADRGTGLAGHVPVKNRGYIIHKEKGRSDG